MTSMEELESRVTALEQQIRSVREDAAAARVLAGGADRDVSAFGARLDAHQRLLQALRETQVGQGGRLDGIDGRLDGIDGRLDRVETELRSGFATLAGGQAEIVRLLERLEPGSAEDGDPGR